MSGPPGVAVITGASSGIGAALALELSQQGWAVGLIARRTDRLEAISARIRAAQGTVAIAAADVSNRSQVTLAIDSIRDRLGAIDLLVANAGISRPDYLEPFTVDDIEQMFQVNTLGVVYSINAVLPDMMRRKSGHLAAVSSSGAYKGMPGSAGYCASKSAVNTFLEGLRIQLRDHNIAVTTICPGFVRTPMTDTNTFRMPWLVEPSEAARRIVRALKRRKKVYNFPWQMTLVIKLFRLLPDWAVARFVPRKSDSDRSVFE
jgi:short-subunit dehydrogenase